MGRRLLLGSVLVLMAAAPPPKEADWSKQELLKLFAQIEVAGRAPTVEAKDADLARLIGGAYRIAPSAGESLDAFSRRVLKARDPGHPTVRPNQWLVALSRRFYDDAGQRAGVLARLERLRKDQRELELKSKEALAAAQILAGMLEIQVPGAQGFVAPLPTAMGEPPTQAGVEAWIRGGKITLKDLVRATFIDDQPPADIERTGTGAIRELVAAQKQFNLEAQTLGMVDQKLRKGLGKLRVFIPATVPAIYLNELARAAKEVPMRALYVMVHDRASGGLRELSFELAPASSPLKKRGKAATPPPIQVSCRDQETMQACVDRIIEQAKEPPRRFVVE